LIKEPGGGGWILLQGLSDGRDDPPPPPRADENETGGKEKSGQSGMEYFLLGIFLLYFLFLEIRRYF
jgi:hypothetical protein